MPSPGPMPLSAERWRVLSPYLDEALDVDIARRATWLAAIRSRDPQLAADLQMLLEEQQAIHDTGFLESAIHLGAAAMPGPSLAGEVLGAYRLLKRWIEQGRPYGQETDPKVTHIEVLPAERLMEREGTQQIVVIAHYSNGSTEDVTRTTGYRRRPPS